MIRLLQKNTIYAFTLLVLPLFFSNVALTQGDISIPGQISEQQFLNEERGQLQNAQVGNLMVPAPSPIELLHMCSGNGHSDYGYIDLHNVGYPDGVRAYGADVIPREMWQQAGARLLNFAYTRARVKAEAEIIRAMRTHVLAEDKLIDSLSMGLNDLNLSQSVETTIISKAAEYIRGGIISGKKIVVTDAGSVCAIVRYDVPLRNNNFPNSVVTSPSPANSASSSQSGQQGENIKYPVLPPGTAGDF